MAEWQGGWGLEDHVQDRFKSATCDYFKTVDSNVITRGSRSAHPDSQHPLPSGSPIVHIQPVRAGDHLIIKIRTVIASFGECPDNSDHPNVLESHYSKRVKHCIRW